MNKEIEYIELMSPILDCFRIYSKNIEKFAIKTHEINLENTNIIQNVIQEMILIINDIDNIIDIDNLLDFDIDSSEISEIRVVYKNENEKTYLVNMTYDEYNRGQMNGLDGDKVYISIRDESDSVLNDID